MILSDGSSIFQFVGNWSILNDCVVMWKVFLLNALFPREVFKFTAMVVTVNRLVQF